MNSFTIANDIVNYQNLRIIQKRLLKVLLALDSSSAELCF